MMRLGRIAMLGLLVASVSASAQSEVNSDPAEVLKQHQVPATAAGVMDLLRGHVVDAAQQKTIAKLLAQLGSDEFEQREQASEALERLGIAALEPLRQARNNPDAEVKQRVSDLLAKIDKPEAVQRREQLALAAVRWLERERPEGSAALLLEVLPHLPGVVRDTATVALWKTTTAKDGDRLRKAYKDGTGIVRAAVLPALEMAEGVGAEPLLREALTDRDAALRLAAARALLDRQRRAALPVLVDLLGHEDAGIRSQSARLLQRLSGIPDGKTPGSLEWNAASARWKAWVTLPEAEKAAPLGLARLNLERYGLLMAESFAQEARVITTGYGPFGYATDVQGKAAVVGGRLRLDGNHAEGDQRLVLTAEKLLGSATFPRDFQIKTTLGGEAENSGGWHVGVSVGKVRLLFHPDVPNGAFRIERVADKFFLQPNENMPFTPAANVLHEMTIDVRQQADGSVRLEIVVADGQKKGRDFRKSIKLAAGEIGPISQIGLERSGRTGGAALFGSLRIQQAD